MSFGNEDSVILAKGHFQNFNNSISCLCFEHVDCNLRKKVILDYALNQFSVVWLKCSEIALVFLNFAL